MADFAVDITVQDGIAMRETLLDLVCRIGRVIIAYSNTNNNHYKVNRRVEFIKTVNVLYQYSMLSPIGLKYYNIHVSNLSMIITLYNVYLYASIKNN